MKILGFAEKSRPLSFWLLMLAMTAYLGMCAFLFVQWVDPSLDGRIDMHIGADSTVYLYMADVVREGRNDPFVWASLAFFPNTLWMPVLIATVLKSTLAIAMANLTLFWLSIRLFGRSAEINVGVLVFFLLLNPTTTVSLLTVNKEVVDMFVVALSCYFLSRGWRWALFLALAIALINRYEVCAALLGFLVMRSRLNPWRERRILTLVLLTVFLTIALPVAMSDSLNSKFIEADNTASSTGLIVFLDQLEMHYMFALAVIPKILENLFGQLFNPASWTRYTLDDPANSYILLFNNLATAIVLSFLARKKSLTLRSDWMYLAWTIAVFMTIALVIQPRYFYLCYVLFCFQASQLRSGLQVYPQFLSNECKLAAT